MLRLRSSSLVFYLGMATAEVYTLSLHDALPILFLAIAGGEAPPAAALADLNRQVAEAYGRSEEHTSELQSLRHLVCRLLLEKKNSNPESQWVRISRRPPVIRS